MQARRDLLNELLAVGVEVIASQEPQSDSQQGQRYVISGTLSQPRAYYQKLIEQHGATLSSSVSANTTAVVTPDPASTSSKVKKAHKLNVPLITEQELLQRLEQKLPKKSKNL